MLEPEERRKKEESISNLTDPQEPVLVAGEYPSAERKVPKIVNGEEAVAGRLAATHLEEEK